MSKAMSGDKVRTNSHCQKRLTLMQMYMQIQENEDQPYKNSVDLASSYYSNNSRCHVNQSNHSFLSGKKSNHSLLYQFDSSNTSQDKSKGRKSRNSLTHVFVTSKTKAAGAIKTNLVQVEQPKQVTDSTEKDGQNSNSHNSSFGATVEQMNQ